jgi:hypothetical protein
MKVVNKKVNLNLVGLNANAFNLLSIFRRKVREENWTDEEINKVVTEASSGDYNHLLQTLMEHTK